MTKEINQHMVVTNLLDRMKPVRRSHGWMSMVLLLQSRDWFRFCPHPGKARKRGGFLKRDTHDDRFESFVKGDGWGFRQTKKGPRAGSSSHPSTSRLQRDPTIEASSEYGSSKVWNRVCKGGKAENSADGDGECKGAARAWAGGLRSWGYLARESTLILYFEGDGWERSGNSAGRCLVGLARLGLNSWEVVLSGSGWYNTLPDLYLCAPYDPTDLLDDMGKC